MFHPKEPNFFLSYINEWKKVRLKSIFFHFLDFGWFSTNLYEYWLYDFNIFYFKPLGGSDVIFIDFYNKFIGKLSTGIEVNQIQNSSLLFKFNNFSSDNKNDGSKWQFYKTTHLPFY